MTVYSAFVDVSRNISLVGQSWIVNRLDVRPLNHATREIFLE